MQLTSGRRGGRGSDKAGARDCAMAMDMDGGPGSGPKGGSSRFISPGHQSRWLHGAETATEKEHRTQHEQNATKERGQNRKLGGVLYKNMRTGIGESSDELENEHNEFASQAGKNSYDAGERLDFKSAGAVRKNFSRPEYRDEDFEANELERGKQDDYNAANVERHGRWGARATDKAGTRDIAMDPTEPASEAQRRAMHAAASGKSTLGIPKSVGEKTVKEWGEAHDA